MASHFKRIRGEANVSFIVIETSSKNQSAHDLSISMSLSYSFIWLLLPFRCFDMYVILKLSVLFCAKFFSQNLCAERTSYGVCPELTLPLTKKSASPYGLFTKLFFMRGLMFVSLILMNSSRSGHTGVNFV